MHPISFIFLIRPLPYFCRYQIRLTRSPRKCVRGMGGNGGDEKRCRVGKGRKHHSFICRDNYGVIWKSWIRSWIPLYLHPIWIAVKALPYWRVHGSRLQWVVLQVIILSMNTTKILWQRWKSPIMEVWNHLHLQVCGVWCEFSHIWRLIYSLMMWIVIIIDMDYDFFDMNYYLWCGLWLFLTVIMMIFVVLYVYVMYHLFLKYLGTDIKKRKPTVQS